MNKTPTELMASMGDVLHGTSHEGKKYANPWDIPGMPYKTEAGYFSFIRGLLRKGWSRHAVKTAFVKLVRKRVPKGKNGRVVWGGVCNICRKEFHKADMQVDHIKPAGSCRSYEEVATFTHGLFHVVFDDLQYVCIPCHQKVTNMERWGCTREEVPAYTAFSKFNNSKMKKADKEAWLRKRNIEPASTVPKMVLQARALLNIHDS